MEYNDYLNLINYYFEKTEEIENKRKAKEAQKAKKAEREKKMIFWQKVIVYVTAGAFGLWFMNALRVSVSDMLR